MSASEDPYDIFICYKETAGDGQRTLDSVLAQDIYDVLTDKGYRVFFARITLEDKLGQEYEPYIFAALHSAKIMLAFGTDFEYFNAVWVKNEWGRFLKLMAKNKDKHLIPCYKGIDAYDMPPEFAKLQAQDLGKVGATQDLLRGIEKILTPQAQTKVIIQEQAAGTNVAPLLERAFMFLEDGNWTSANEYCEKVLDSDPKNATAYLGKLMAELKVKKQENLTDCAEPFDQNDNYQKVIRFGDAQLKNALSGCIDYINTRNENARLNGIYTQAKNAMAAAKTNKEFYAASKIFDSISEYQDSAALAEECRQKALEYIYDHAKAAMANAKIDTEFHAAAKLFESISEYQDSAVLAEECRQKAQEYIYNLANTIMSSAKTNYAFTEVARLFESIAGYQDSAQLAAECLEKAEVARKDAIYEAAITKINSPFCSIRDYNHAINAFQSIPGWKDADEQVAICKNKIAELSAKEEAARQESKRQAEIVRTKQAKAQKIAALIAIAILCAAIALVICVLIPVIKENRYTQAVDAMEDGDYEIAYYLFTNLGEYKDSADFAKEAEEQLLQSAETLYLAGNADEAVSLLKGCDIENDIATAYRLVADGQYTEAVDLGLTDIVIPDGTTKISDGAFSRCTGLTSVTIPDSVIYIYFFAFDNCSNLKTAYFQSQAQLEKFRYWFPENCQLIVQ